MFTLHTPRIIQLGVLGFACLVGLFLYAQGEQVTGSQESQLVEKPAIAVVATPGLHPVISKPAILQAPEKPLQVSKKTHVSQKPSAGKYTLPDEEIFSQTELHAIDQEVNDGQDVPVNRPALTIPHETDEILSTEDEIIIAEDHDERLLQLVDAMEAIHMSDPQLRDKALMDLWVLAADTGELQLALDSIQGVAGISADRVRNDLLQLQEGADSTLLSSYLQTVTGDDGNAPEFDVNSNQGLAYALTPSSTPRNTTLDVEEFQMAQERQYSLQSQALYGRNVEERFQALGQLDQYRDLDSALDTLLQATADTDAGNRRLALQILSHAAFDQKDTDPQILNSLEQARHDSDENVAIFADSAFQQLQASRP